MLAAQLRHTSNLYAANLNAHPLELLALDRKAFLYGRICGLLVGGSSRKVPIRISVWNLPFRRAGFTKTPSIAPIFYAPRETCWCFEIVLKPGPNSLSGASRGVQPLRWRGVVHRQRKDRVGDIGDTGRAHPFLQLPQRRRDETLHHEAEGSHRLNPCAAPIARVTTIMIMMTMTALFFVYHILAVRVSRFDS